VAATAFRAKSTTARDRRKQTDESDG
jgi:hypothetical protein